MKYQNLDMKMDQFVAYVSSDKINLIPSFQRGHVWKLPTRRKLIANIVQGRPIPAIFLYREASGDQYAYNILDAKQRLESLILFIGGKRSSLAIQNLNKYFFQKRHREAADFWIEIDGKKKSLKDLDDDLFREFQEYVIPTIEITLRLSETRLATNQIHFYTLMTSIIGEELLTKFSEAELIKKLAAFGQILDKKVPLPKNLAKTMVAYRELSEKQTTHVARRTERQQKFTDAITAL